jgi:hypothetical protein
MRVVLPAGGNLTVWERAVPRKRMREIFTSGSVGRSGAQAPGFTRPADMLPA